MSQQLKVNKLCIKTKSARLFVFGIGQAKDL